VFTGLVEDLGTITDLQRSAEGVEISVRTSLVDELREGDSIAVNGVCLTATAVSGDSFAAQITRETVSRSSLADAEPGSEVNLELPLRAADRLGGHLVQGHVDGVGTITGVAPEGNSCRIEVDAPAELMRYVVEKGSIAVDGISLTVADLDEQSFTVSLIPETLKRTNLGHAQPGRNVNLEVDVLAKYVERLMGARA
jgi:riboflavin synthase